MRPGIDRLALAALAVLGVLAIRCERPAGAVAASTTARSTAPAPASPALGERHRGVSWVAGARIPATALAPLAAVNVDWIVQTPFGWQPRHDAPGLTLKTSGGVLWGETDEGLEVTTRLARELGIRTLLKPHIWLTRAEGRWRGEIAMTSEADWRRWFDEYRRFILHYARLAERLGIEGLAVGTELRATVRERPDDWRRLIAAVRAVYRGRLTYSANWYREFEEVPFWEALDYVGIQGYFPLADGPRPTLAELMAGWQRHLPAIEAVVERTGKPLLFTEIGYRNSADAAIEPWRWPARSERLAGATDPGTQARCYEAFFRTFWHRPWFAGAYIWKWFPGPPRRRGVSFSPQGQAAEEVLARWYRRAAGHHTQGPP